ncbi:DinB family protein [Chitinophaga sp. HK235]|uniref:DinB family protein n=1 Tax=Chitinophaga sp. HK235 TaxID=2952571 RepID=UPI001BAAA622|nr:DinB family protein [Chitinophaga sp. HK235]
MIQTTTDTHHTSLADFAKGYAAYNLWADQTMIAWLQKQDPALLEKEVVSSFPTIKHTLKHMLSTASWWMKNLRGEHPGLTYGPVECQESVAEVLAGVVAVSEELMELVSSMTAEQLQQAYLVTIPFVGDFNIPGYEMLPQIINHTAYHRGQVVTMGRHLGITDGPNTDYMYYVLVGAQRY